MPIASSMQHKLLLACFASASGKCSGRVTPLHAHGSRPSLAGGCKECLFHMQARPSQPPNKGHMQREGSGPSTSSPHALQCSLTMISDHSCSRSSTVCPSTMYMYMHMYIVCVIVWVPHGGLLHVLRHRHGKRRYRNRLLLHALLRWWGHCPVLPPRQVAMRRWRLSWLSGPTVCNLHSVPRAHWQLGLYTPLQEAAHKTAWCQKRAESFADSSYNTLLERTLRMSAHCLPLGAVISSRVTNTEQNKQ